MRDPLSIQYSDYTIAVLDPRNFFVVSDELA